MPQILQDDLVADAGNAAAERVARAVYSLFPSLHRDMGELAAEAHLAAEEALALLPASHVVDVLAWLTRLASRHTPPSGPSARRSAAALPRLLCSLLKQHAAVLASGAHMPYILRLLLAAATNASLPYAAITALLAPLAPLFALLPPTAATHDALQRSAAADDFATHSYDPPS